MIPFRASDPFPLLSPGTFTEAEAEAHGELVDRWLGLETSRVEQRLANRGCLLRASSLSREHQELWIGLAVQRMLTPYVDIRLILEHLRVREGQIVVDLGAAYGRAGFVVSRCFPKVQFVGYEYVGERVAEARRCYRRQGLCNQVVIEHADLMASDFRPRPADVYFIYDYGTSKAIEKTLHDLRRIASDREFRLIVRGSRCAEAIRARHSWLTESSSAPSARLRIFSAHCKRALFDGCPVVDDGDDIPKEIEKSL